MRTTILGCVVLALGCADGSESDKDLCKPWHAGCGPGGAPFTLVVSGVDMEQVCEDDWWHPPSLQQGTYDVADTGRACQRAYAEYFLFASDPTSQHALNLLVKVFADFQVTLMTADGGVIAFDDPLLPNPFGQTLMLPLAMLPEDDTHSTSIERVELVPAEYRAALKRFAGKTIQATLGLHASGDSAEEDSGKAFEFPIQLCDGCLTACASSHVSADAGACDVETGVEPRMCVDPDC